LDDATLDRQSWRHFSEVLHPKAAGAWNLHLATRDLSVESFVMFSAGAGLLGSPGQANYAAANAFLDGLAQWRRAHGLPALSIAWGPWADVGMAARSGRDWSAKGLAAISPAAGVVALHLLQRGEAAYAAVLPIDWQLYPIAMAHGRKTPFFDLVAETAALATAPAKASERWLDALTGLPVQERAATLEKLLVIEIAHVLGMGVSRSPSPKSTLTEIGVDSLMAVELRNRIEAKLGVTVVVSRLLSDDPIAVLASELAAAAPEERERITL
jgi:hypothetical protein